MADATGFEINGTVYEVPTLGSFNMDEAQVLYDYSGLVIEDFIGLLPEATSAEKSEHEAETARRMRNPGLLKALMHIAYQRGNPDEKPARVRELVANENALEALLAFVTAGAEEEDDGLPPASTTEPDASSTSGSVGSNTNSGLPSGNGSDAPDATPVSTGHGRSATLPTLPPISLVV